MKIALVDDEQNFLDKMTQLCNDFSTQNHCQIEIVPFTSGEAFLKAFHSGAFSVVFMDIYMNELNGVAAALKMRDLDNKCILVFVTSSTEFMPEAFSCHAFEYITKPLSPQRIFSVLHDALEVLPASEKYIEVISDRKNVPVFLHNIMSVMTDAHYLQISLTDNTTIRSRMTLADFSQLTNNDARFITVNKGIILNAEYITDFGDTCCILENGAYFPIRVRDCLKIEQAVKDYHFNSIRQNQPTHHRRGKEN